MNFQRTDFERLHISAQHVAASGADDLHIDLRFDATRNKALEAFGKEKKERASKALAHMIKLCKTSETSDGGEGAPAAARARAEERTTKQVFESISIDAPGIGEENKRSIKIRHDVFFSSRGRGENERGDGEEREGATGMQMRLKSLLEHVMEKQLLIARRKEEEEEETE
eukprot:1013744-Rhodomonas_salina.1